MSRANIWMRPSLGLLCGLCAAAVPSYSLGQTAPAASAQATAPVPGCPTVSSSNRQAQSAAQHRYGLHRHTHHRHHHIYAQGSWQQTASPNEAFDSAQASPQNLSGTPGGTQIVYGQAIGTQIGNGGRQVVLSKGFASSSEIQAGGVQSISPGGVAAGTTVSGEGANQIVSANATSVGGSLSNGGSQTVYGHAVDTKIGANGQQTVSAGGVSTNTTAIGVGASQIVAAHASSVGGVLSDGASQTVYGQSAQTQIGTNAQQTVSAGGVSTNTSAVGGGAVQVVLPGGTAVGTNLSSGATQTVYGTSIGAKLGAAGWQTTAPEAKTAAAANAQPAPAFVMWTLFSGIPVGKQFQTWGQQAGWNVVWSLNTDPITTGNLYYFNAFESAAKDAVADLSKRGFKVKATFSVATHTLTLSQP